MIKRRLAWGLVVSLAAVLLAVGWWMQRFADQPLHLSSARIVDFSAGSSLQNLALQLQDEGLLSSARGLMWLARITGRHRNLQAGQYRLQPGITPRQLLQLLAAGHTVQHRYTLVEGRTFREMMAEIGQLPFLRHTLDGLTGKQIMRELGHPSVPAEGHFLPETYHYRAGYSDRQLLARAFAQMASLLDRLWRARDRRLILKTPEQVLTLASIVEKESALDEERPRVAGVFLRRLAMGMRLQADATVIYGLGESFDGNLRRVDLLRDGPYNTYRRAGLPATPIAMPGAASIEAVTHPDLDDVSLYYVARGDGSHVFSATLAEHNRAVRRYQLKRSPAAAAPP